MLNLNLYNPEKIQNNPTFDQALTKATKGLRSFREWACTRLSNPVSRKMLGSTSARMKAAVLLMRNKVLIHADQTKLAELNNAIYLINYNAKEHEMAGSVHKQNSIPTDIVERVKKMATQVLPAGYSKAEREIFCDVNLYVGFANEPCGDLIVVLPSHVSPDQISPEIAQQMRVDIVNGLGLKKAVMDNLRVTKRLFSAPPKPRAVQRS